MWAYFNHPGEEVKQFESNNILQNLKDAHSDPILIIEVVKNWLKIEILPEFSPASMATLMNKKDVGFLIKQLQDIHNKLPNTDIAPKKEDFYEENE